MKWSERTAQGFSPGLAEYRKCPESGTRGWELFVDSQREYQEPRVGRHLRGASLHFAYPGLKPWAVLSDHFMVKKQSMVPTASASRRGRGKEALHGLAVEITLPTVSFELVNLVFRQSFAISYPAIGFDIPN